MAVRAQVKNCGAVLAAMSSKNEAGCPLSLASLLKHRLKQAGVLSALRIVAKQEVGKNPLAEQRPFLADHFIEGHADLVGKTDVQMMAVDGNVLRLEQRGECAQLDRGILRVAERHVDERHLGLVAHLLPRGVS